MDRLGGLVVIAPARRAGDLGSNPGPGENFSLKLLIYDLSDGYSKSEIFIKFFFIVSSFTFIGAHTHSILVLKIASNIYAIYSFIHWH